MEEFVWYTEAKMSPETRLEKAERVRARLMLNPPDQDTWSRKRINNWLDRYIRVRNIIWNEVKKK